MFLYSNAVEIFDDMGLKDPEVRKFWKKKLKLSRPSFNFGAKQKSELQNFVLEVLQVLPNLLGIQVPF